MYGNLKDDELIKLIPALKYLGNVDDVKPIIRQIVDRKMNKIDFNIVYQLIKGNDNKKNFHSSNKGNKNFKYKIIPKKLPIL